MINKLMRLMIANSENYLYYTKNIFFIKISNKYKIF
jgi:hypothetical protein